MTRSCSRTGGWAYPASLARSLHTSNIAFEDLVVDHQRLVEAFEDDDVERAKKIVDSHTERAKLTHRLAFEQAHDRLIPNEER